MFVDVREEDQAVQEAADEEEWLDEVSTVDDDHWCYPVITLKVVM